MNQKNQKIVEREEAERLGVRMALLLLKRGFAKYKRRILKQEKTTDE